MPAKRSSNILEKMSATAHKLHKEIKKQLAAIRKKQRAAPCSDAEGYLPPIRFRLPEDGSVRRSLICDGRILYRAGLKLPKIVVPKYPPAPKDPMREELDSDDETDPDEFDIPGVMLVDGSFCPASSDEDIPVHSSDDEDMDEDEEDDDSVCSSDGEDMGEGCHDSVCPADGEVDPFTEPTYTEGQGQVQREESFQDYYPVQAVQVENVCESQGLEKPQDSSGSAEGCPYSPCSQEWEDTPPLDI